MMRIAVAVLLVGSVISGLVEYLFFNTVDSNGVVQESYFLPLTYILFGCAVVLFAFSRIFKDRK